MRIASSFEDYYYNFFLALKLILTLFGVIFHFMLFINEDDDRKVQKITQEK